MGNKFKLFLKKFSYSFVANLINTVVAVLVVLILPKFISVSNYGYVQLYILYSTYTIYLSLGLNEGAYIRYGGMKYNCINYDACAIQYWISKCICVLGGIGISCVGIYVLNSENEIITLICANASAVLCVPVSIATYILLTTNRVREYAIIVIIERVVYFFGIVVFILLGYQKFEFFILADLIGKFTSVIAACFICRELILEVHIKSFKVGIAEAWENICVGIKITLASLISVLIIGLVRLGILNVWDIDTFSKVSITLTVSNLLLVFIRSVSAVLFPTINNYSLDAIKQVYAILDRFITYAVLFLFVLYYPIRLLIGIWLPQYDESLSYMALLFPMCLFECKVMLIGNTVLKTLRKEKTILLINVVVLVLSVILISMFVFFIRYLTFAVLSITVVLGFRYLITDMIICKFLEVGRGILKLYELLLVVLFICANWFIGGWMGFCVYAASICIFGVLMKKDMHVLTLHIKQIVIK